MENMDCNPFGFKWKTLFHMSRHETKGFGLNVSQITNTAEGDVNKINMNFQYRSGSFTLEYDTNENKTYNTMSLMWPMPKYILNILNGIIDDFHYKDQPSMTSNLKEDLNDVLFWHFKINNASTDLDTEIEFRPGYISIHRKEVLDGLSFTAPVEHVKLIRGYTDLLRKIKKFIKTTPVSELNSLCDIKLDDSDRVFGSEYCATLAINI